MVARPSKSCLEYFNLDVNMDDETKLIIAQHGMEGYGILISMFQSIYGNKGYYHKWTEREQILFSNRVSASKNLVVDVINDCIKWGIFNEDKYNEYQILTSRRIQKHYIHSTYRRAEVEIESKYLVIEEVDRGNITYKGVFAIKNSTAGIVSDGKSTQSKVKYSKVKYSKVYKEESESAPIKEIFDLYNNICKSLPSARKLSDSRRKHIKARWNEEQDISIFEEVFKKAESSSFLTGNNDRGWQANLDWIISNNTNFNKILEGKYDNGGGSGGKPVSRDSNTSNRAEPEPILKRR